MCQRACGLRVLWAKELVGYGFAGPKACGSQGLQVLELAGHRVCSH